MCETYREKGVGVARGPDSAGDKAIQFWEVALGNRFPPVEQTLSATKVVGESFKIIPANTNQFCDLR